MKQLTAAIEKEKADPRQKVMCLWELAKYRLNKKIPKELPFEKRKSLLVESQEWNGWIHQHNDHLPADELTEENLQQEIDTVGSLWGIELTKQFAKLEWLPIALNSAVCHIYIP